MRLLFLACPTCCQQCKAERCWRLVRPSRSLDPQVAVRCPRGWIQLLVAMGNGGPHALSTKPGEVATSPSGRTAIVFGRAACGVPHAVVKEAPGLKPPALSRDKLSSGLDAHVLVPLPVGNVQKDAL